MKVGIDASRLRKKMTGIGRYTEGILARLERELPEATFVLYARRECIFVLPSSRWSVCCDTHPVLSRLPTTLWIHYRLGSFAKKDGLDVFWAANTLAPRKAGGFVPYVTTVHDLIHLLVPETLSRHMRFAYRRWFRTDVLGATRIVAISQGTSARLEQHLGRGADAIVLPAVPLLPLNRGLIEEVLAERGVRRPFLLTVGAPAPRKNLSSVVAAVGLLKSRGKLADYELVMAGAERRDKTGDPDGLPDSEPWIRPIGYVDDATLANLYASAEVFVFPSLYEGYGMPVAEARSLGCRVVTTDSPELREAGDSWVVYVAPTLEGVASGLEIALSQPRPPSRVPGHDWEGASRIMALMLGQAASHRKQSAQGL